MMNRRYVLLSACFALLSVTLFADYSDDEEYEVNYGDEVADAPMYPVISQECLDIDAKQAMHHYVLYGEMLYLKPYLGSAPWTYVQNKSNYQNPASLSTSFESISEKIENLSMDFDFGFRVGLGFNTTWLKLENQLTWMRLHTHTSQSLPTLTEITGVSTVTNYGQPVVYVPFWTSTTDLLPPGQEMSATARNTLHWDEIDWVFKIPLKPYKKLAVLPVLGVRGLLAKIKSYQTQVFSAYGETFSTNPPLNSSTTDLEEKFNAVGLLAGFEGDVSFGYGLHLSSLLDASAVFGNVKRSNHSVTSVPVISGDLVPQDYLVSDENNKFKPLFDAQVVLSWNWNFCKNKLSLNTHIGYEIHFMPRFIEFIRVIDDGDTPYYYDLTLQGLNAGLGLSF